MVRMTNQGRHAFRVGAVAATLIAGAVAFVLNGFQDTAIMSFVPGRVLTLALTMLVGPWEGLAAGLAGVAGMLRTTMSNGLLIAYVGEVLCVCAAVRLRRSPLLVGAGYWAGVCILFALVPDWFGAGHLRQAV
jgi:hypothetical protein